MEKETVTLRGTKDGLLIILDEEKEFPVIKSRLMEKFNAATGFFNGAEVTVDFGQRDVEEAQRQEIETLLNTKYGLKQIRFLPSGREKVRDQDKGEQNSQKTWDEPVERETLMIKRTLRSGQTVSFHGNVVIFGDVNPGAEVVAGGDILVFGSLRGIAHAGAQGDEGAVVAAYLLFPTQLRIANYITRSPDEDLKKPNSPEIAKIKNEMIIIETYALHGNK